MYSIELSHEGVYQISGYQCQNRPETKTCTALSCHMTVSIKSVDINVRTGLKQKLVQHWVVTWRCLSNQWISMSEQAWNKNLYSIELSHEGVYQISGYQCQNRPQTNLLFLIFISSMTNTIKSMVIQLLTLWDCNTPLLSNDHVSFQF